MLFFSSAHKANHSIWGFVLTPEKSPENWHNGRVLIILCSYKKRNMLFVFTFSELSWEQNCLQLRMGLVAHVHLIRCHLLRWGVWNSPDTLCMGGLLFTADKAKILRITWRYHITHKMELLLFSSKTYSVSPGQRKERTANHKKTEPIKDLCKPELLGFKLFSFSTPFLSLSLFFFFNKRDVSSWTAKLM